MDAPNLVRFPVGATPSYSASEFFSASYSPDRAADGIKSNSTGLNLAWATNGVSAGDWWRVDWTAGQDLDQIWLWDRGGGTDYFGNSGTIEFSDGSSVPYSGLPDDAGASGENYLVVSFSRKSGITWFRVVTDGGGVGNGGLAEVEAYDGFSYPSIARVTSEAAETLIEPTSQNARVTQVLSEAVVAPTTQNVRVTRLVVEVLVLQSLVKPRAYAQVIG